MSSYDLRRRRNADACWAGHHFVDPLLLSLQWLWYEELGQALK
jgi:hypothetical protein